MLIIKEHNSFFGLPESHKAVQAEAGCSFVKLRPVNQKDLFAWQHFISKCSTETLYSRFLHLGITAGSLHTAARYCTVNTFDEYAWVAELTTPGLHQTCIIGDARLHLSADGYNAELSVFIADEWQNKKLGTWITSHCLTHAGILNVERIVVRTTDENDAMLRILRRFGFILKYNPDDHFVFGSVFLKKLTEKSGAYNLKVTCLTIK